MGKWLQEEEAVGVVKEGGTMNSKFPLFRKWCSVTLVGAICRSPQKVHPSDRPLRLFAH